MKKLLAALWIISFAVLPFAGAQSIENATIEREEYAVYSAIIVDYVFEERGVMVIANPTITSAEPIKPKDLQFLSTNLKEILLSASPPAVSQETVDDFLKRNKVNRWLGPKLEISRKYVLVDFREIKKLVNWADPTDQAWNPFRTMYSESDGFISLSRVGFNGSIDQALVHIGWRCPGLCGHWSYLLLTKKGGNWNVIGEANRIVS